MRLLVTGDLAVGVGGGNKGDGVKAGSVEGHHGNNQEDQNERCKRQRLDDGDDRCVEIAAGGIDRHDVQLSAYLKSETVVS